jgi:hypothetical protein
MGRTGFTPQQHGFHFDNDFVNNVANLPGFGNIQTRGRCGGMAYAALDFYFAGIPVPSDTTLPPDGSPLADYIYRRLMDSFVTPSAVQFVSWTLHADHGTWFFKGVTRWTKEDQIPRLRGFIDAGQPVALGLVGATDLGDVGNKNHQVVAYGYDVDEPTQAIRIYIYDNNSHDQEVVVSTDPGNPHVDASNRGEPWRGLFVQSYAPVSPPPALVPAPIGGWWSASGQLASSDGDLIDYTVEPDAVGQDAVEFVLASGLGITWRKELQLVDGQGSTWTVATQDQTTEDRNGLYMDQLPGGHLAFRKAKWVGTMWEVYRLEQLDQLKPGTRVTFRWIRD